MIPSRAWFPGALQDRAAWFDNFTLNFTAIGLSLGFIQKDIDDLNEDNDMFQFLAAKQTQVDAFADAVRQFRINITEGEIGDPPATIPANPTTVPPTMVDTGIFERLVHLVERIRVAPNYNPETGTLLGIVPKPNSPTNGISEEELKPIIKASESYMNYKFSANVTKMGQPLFKLQYQKQTNGEWKDLITTNQNPAVVTVEPTVPGQPERIQVRAILMKGENTVGQPSDPTYVTVNP